MTLSDVQIADRQDRYIGIATLYLRNLGYTHRDQIYDIVMHFWNRGMSLDEQMTWCGFGQEGRFDTQIRKKLTSFPFITLKDQSMTIVIQTIEAYFIGISGEHAPYFYEMYERTREWFDWEYAQLFPDNSMRDEIYGLLELGSGEDAEIFRMIREMTTQCLKTGTIRDMQPLIRAYQSLQNHFPRVRGEWIYSTFTSIMMYSYLEIVDKKPDITTFYQNVVIAHRSIGEMCEWKREADIVHRDQMRAFHMRYQSVQDSFLETLPPCHREYMPILHHVLDWMISTIPAELHKKKPLYIFGVTWRAMHHLHNWIGHDILPEDFYYLNEYEFSNFIRSTGISLQGYRYQQDARFGMEAVLYYRDDIDGSLFFPILSAKNDDILSKQMERLRIVNAEKFEEEYTT